MNIYIHVYAVLDGAAHRMLMHAWLATACTVSDKSLRTELNSYKLSFLLESLITSKRSMEGRTEVCVGGGGGGGGFNSSP